MYTISKYNEVDLEYIYKATLTRVACLKTKRKITKPKLRLLVVFRNVLEPDFSKIYLHVLMLWMMTGKLGKVRKIGHSLRRGIRYYRFVLSVSLFDDFRFFRFSEFALYCLFDYVGKSNYNCVINRLSDSFFIVKNIGGFTNLRFSDSFYLSGMPGDLVINYVKPDRNINYLHSTSFFLKLLKLI